MDYNFKLKMIGYYTGDNQTMKPEKRFVKEAETMATLLDLTFSNSFKENNLEKVADKHFIEALKGNAVYFFEDENKYLIAYYHLNHMVRFSHVVKNPDCFVQSPLCVQSFFIPGEAIPITNEPNTHFFFKEKYSVS